VGREENAAIRRRQRSCRERRAPTQRLTFRPEYVGVAIVSFIRIVGFLLVRERRKPPWGDRLGSTATLRTNDSRMSQTPVQV
jgi:hypothetical protein